MNTLFVAVAVAAGLISQGVVKFGDLAEGTFKGTRKP